ncbi:hypothetical protein Sjap_002340 [Stephania japonica]|uniref:Uncharacterized protein n=1 Tax=Stephania japonica TaxID=461633 RepID=A0AAP0KPB3_9MAGN
MKKKKEKVRRRRRKRKYSSSRQLLEGMVDFLPHTWVQINNMAYTKRTEDVRKVEKARKTEEVNKKTVETGKRISRRAQTTSYRKSKELGRGKGESELHDEAFATLASKGRELAIHSSQFPHLSQVKRIRRKCKTNQARRKKEKMKMEPKVEKKNEEAHEEGSESEDEKVEEKEGCETGEEEEEEEEGEND